MDKVIKNRWLKALRSGKYKQSKCALKKPLKKGVGYCCLGVLCDIVSKTKFGKLNGMKFENELDDIQQCYNFKTDTDIEYGDLPREIINKYFDGQFGEESKHIGTLIDMNDRGKKFKTIANYIEKNL